MNPVRNRKKRVSCRSLIFSLLVLSLSVIGLNARLFSAQASAPIDTIEGNMDDIARAMLTYFPKAVGEIAAIESDGVQIAIDQEHQLVPGLLLIVFREGEPFFHPATGVLLGRFEDEIAILETLRIASPYLLAAPVETLGNMAVGDRVRIPATRIPLAVSVSSASDHAFLMNELVSALSDTGRFQIKTLPPGADTHRAREAGAHYHIQLQTDRIETQFSMHLEIQNTLTEKSLAALDVLINQSDESDLILEHLQYQLFEQRQKK